jgi:hypothetical protein
LAGSASSLQDAARVLELGVLEETRIAGDIRDQQIAVLGRAHGLPPEEALGTALNYSTVTEFASLRG